MARSLCLDQDIFIEFTIVKVADLSSAIEARIHIYGPHKSKVDGMEAVVNIVESSRMIMVAATHYQD
jgi:hypothetical protein